MCGAPGESRIGLQYSRAAPSAGDGTARPWGREGFSRKTLITQDFIVVVAGPRQSAPIAARAAVAVPFSPAARGRSRQPTAHRKKRHGGDEFVVQQCQATRHAMRAVRGECVDLRPAQHHGIRAERKRLEHIGPAPDAGVHQQAGRVGPVACCRASRRRGNCTAIGGHAIEHAPPWLLTTRPRAPQPQRLARIFRVKRPPAKTAGVCAQSHSTRPGRGACQQRCANRRQEWAPG